MFKRLSINNYLLIFILIAGFVIRLTFLFWGADIFYAKESKFINNDSFSFSQSFLNLLQYGTFSFDFSHPDAYFGRLPGYPYFWGLHYLIFGPKNVYLGVAVTQLVLDVSAIYLIYKIAIEVSRNQLASFVTSSIYAFYPFIIVWITITGTELLGSFLTILFFYWLLCKPINTKNVIITSLIVAAAFYVREYLGILIIAGFIHYAIQLKLLSNKFFKYSFIFGFIFSCIYVLWPIRNYLTTERIILLKTKNSGYHRFGEDIVSARTWLYTWTNDADIYLDSIANPNAKITLPKHIFSNPKDIGLAYQTINMARTCGTGFYNWRTFKIYPNPNNCNSIIENNFQKLIKSNKLNNPELYYLAIPFNNFKKAIFKNKLLNQTPKLFTKILFFYRTILILIAVTGVVLNCKNPLIYPIIFFVIFIYIFICFFIRQVEMRYLLQADVITLVFTSLLFTRIIPIKFEHFLLKNYS